MVSLFRYFIYAALSSMLFCLIFKMHLFSLALAFESVRAAFFVFSSFDYAKCAQRCDVFTVLHTVTHLSGRVKLAAEGSRWKTV